MNAYRIAALVATTFALVPATAYAADTTIVITSKTRAINVHENDSVLFKIGTQQFTHTFDGNKTVYQLSALAPKGTKLPQKIRVLVAPNPTLHQQGI